MLIDKKRAFQIMDKYDLDVMIATTKGNVAYTVDYWPVGAFRPGGHQTFSILPRDEQKCPAVIMPISDLSPWLSRKSWVREIWPYGTYYVEAFDELAGDERQLKEIETELRATRPSFDNAIEALVSAIKQKGLARAKIGLDEMNIPPQHIEILKQEFPEAEISFAYEIFREIRLIKTPEEIARIRASTKISEIAVQEVCEAIREGMTEKELVSILKSAIGRERGIPVLWYVGCGTGSALTDRDATDYRVKKGDWVMFDVGCCFEHYYSDIARSVVVGEPSPKQVKYYEAILKGRAQALEMIKPGITAGEIFDAAVQSIRDSGISHFKRHSIGHSTGIEPYDPPILAPGSNFVIEEGMVLNVETPYYELGFGGIQLEDTLLITGNGFEYLSSLPQELRAVG